jgi:hypothetical protein
VTIIRSELEETMELYGVNNEFSIDQELADAMEEL